MRPLVRSSRPAVRRLVARLALDSARPRHRPVAEPPGLIGPLGQPLLVGFSGPGVQRRALEPHDPDAADPPALHLLGDEEMAVDLDRLAFGGDVPADGEHEAADGVPVPVGQVGAEELVHLVDGHLARDAELAAAERHDQGLVDVELVDDLADELLDEVLERHDAGRAAVLVDDDGEVELARPASRA